MFEIGGLQVYLLVAAGIFLLGSWGVFMPSRNIIFLMMSIEAMLLGVNLAALTFSVAFGDLMAKVLVLYILTVAAAEAAVGLGILVTYYRVTGSVSIEHVNLMRG